MLEELNIKYYKTGTFTGFYSTELYNVKHSPNLIDIIKLGDCVKLFMEEFVDESKVEEDTNIFEVIAITTDKKEIGVFTKDFEIEFFPIENIREIYTQERMDSISYKVTKM